MSTPSVLFLGELYAGHRTRFANLRHHLADDARIRPEFRTVTGWVENGFVERLGFLPKGARGRLRAVAQARPLARLHKPDVIWTTAGELIAPYAWSQLGPLHRPMVFETDCAPGQIEADAQLFWGRPPHKGARRAIGRLIVRLVTASASRFVVWSQWAAGGMERIGIGSDRIRVVPPGVDLDAWQPAARQSGGSIKLLFVGADFERKGGRILLDAVRSRTDRFTLDIVTRSTLPPASWYRVHSAEPNSPSLRRLYAEADLFVLPTRAECFGLATVEALACGLPAIIGDTGAAREIVDEGETGYVIESNATELARVLDAVAGHKDRLGQMGLRARAVAEERFDGKRNDTLLVDILIEEHEKFQALHHAAPPARG